MRVSDPLPKGRGVVLGPAPGGYDGDGLQEDLDDLVVRGATAVVCLIEDEEFLHLHGEPGPATFRDAVAQRGLPLLRVPIEDFAAPTREQVEAVAGFVAQAPGLIYVHCMAGLGRAGTVAAALLVRDGMPADDAILLVRWMRPGAIQSEAQEAFVRMTEAG